MSEEDKTKQFDKEQLDKLLVELKDIDNFKGFEDGAFKYSLGKYQASLLVEHIEQLQQENEELKKHLIIPENVTLKTLEDYKDYYSDTTKEYILNDTYIEYCAYLNTIHILIEFEKWLEEKMNFYKINNQGYSYEFYKETYDKLQELKRR